METQWSTAKWLETASHPDIRRRMLLLRLERFHFKRLLMSFTSPWAADCSAGQGALPEVP